MDGRRKSGQERRKYILNWLKNSPEPITGQLIADETNVSRQVIVQDISLLKAMNEPIVATAQGYVYINNSQSDLPHKRIIACHHSPDKTRNELMIIVDHGVNLQNVIVEHPIYGELTASLMIKNRRDAKQFLDKVQETSASYLSELTDGVHLHTLEAETIDQLDETCAALEEAGILLSKE